MNDKIVKAFLETDMGSFRYQAIEGEAPTYPHMLKKMPKALKKYVATLWDGTKIFIVDGKWIRDNVDVSFVGGTHPLEAGWMPKKELFIEDCKDSGDMIFLLLHEMVEYIQMSLAKTKYEKAHDISNSCEHAARCMAKLAGK